MTHSRHAKITAVILLTVTVLIVYGNVGRFDFIRYDEELYVTKNPHVLSGLNRESLRWAMTTLDAGFWHPLTWLSLMVDRELFGADAGGYHWTNVALHLLGGLILFFAMTRMTGHIWRSAAVAGVFLLHPLHVEPVAWVAARKDVLSGLFWMAAIWAYAGYVQRPRVGRYLWAVLFFIMGVMSKPMVVTLPLVLLLLDYWPLERTAGRATDAADGGASMFEATQLSSYRLILEKIPFVCISCAAALLAFEAEKRAGALPTLDTLSLSLRLDNALVSYVRYLGKTLWPVDLSFFYPHPLSWPSWQVVLSTALLISICAGALHRGKRYRYIPVGWLWFLITLLPVIGVIQVGSHAMADRYAHLPLIGLSIIAIWGSGDIGRRRQNRRILVPASWGMILLIMAVWSWQQVQHWRNSAALFEHAIGANEDNYMALNNYGVVLMERREYPQAAAHFLAVLRNKPNFAVSQHNMGKIMALQGHHGAAAGYFREAINIRPDYTEAKRSLGDLLLQVGQWEEALFLYRELLLRDPADPELYNNLGVALASVGKVMESAANFQVALRLKPDYDDARKNLDAIEKSTTMTLP